MEIASFPVGGETLHSSFTAAHGEARALIVVVHGFAEHSGRYARIIGQLADRGYAVFAYDYRGHGRATGARGHADRFERYVDDLRAACAAARRHAPGKRMALLAQSHGGLIALRALCDPDRSLDAAAAGLASPVLGVALEVPAWKKVLGRVASRAVPRLTMPHGLNADDFSHDPQVAPDYRADPLNHKVATARWYTEMIAAQAYVLENAARIQVPTLWLLAGDDRVVSVPAAEAVFARAGGGKKKYRSDGPYHALYLERADDRARVVADLFSWLDGRFPAA